MFIAEYGVAFTAYFPLIDFGATSFEDTPVTIAAGDATISKDGAAFANSTNNFAHVGGGVYEIDLTAAEMQAKTIVVKIIDQTGTKEWEDQAIVIQTVNHASAQLPNLWADVKEWDSATPGENPEDSLTTYDAAAVSDLPTAAQIAAEILRRDIASENDEDSAGIFSLVNVILHFASKIDATTGIVYKSDGTTAFATRTPTTDPDADPITSLGVAS